jgi:hypothetical protein
VIDYEGAPPLADASGGGADDIYSCGAYGVILHYDGTAWSPLPSQTGEAFSAIWARGANDLWVAGSAAVMRHFDGRSWTEQAVPGGAMILGMSGTGAATGPRQGLAVGESGRILGFDGTSWKLLDNPDTTSLLDVWAAGADDAFAVGLSGTIVRYQAIGNTWTRMDSGTTASLFGVHGSAVGDVWVAGDGVILHHDGSAWRLSYTSSGTAFLAVWARSAIDVFAVAGHGGIFHYDGVSWRPQTSPTSNMLYALWAPASGPIYAFGDGTMVMRYDE